MAKGTAHGCFLHTSGIGSGDGNRVPQHGSHTLALANATLVWYWTSMLWLIDTCQSKVSAEQYHVTILQAHVYNSLRSCSFFLNMFFFLAGSSKVFMLYSGPKANQGVKFNWSTVPLKGKLTVPWNSTLENFEDRGSSWVSRCSRPFENLSSQVSRLLSGKNKGLFVWLTFDTS